MSKHPTKKLFSFILCIVLIAATALFATGCTGSQDFSPTDASAAAVETTFTVVVEDLDGNETTSEITTTAATVGEALLEKGLIEGETGDYGLYIKTVNGITLDWDTHGKYWAFYVDGEYALTGVDSTPVASGAIYRFAPES